MKTTFKHSGELNASMIAEPMAAELGGSRPMNASFKQTESMSADLAAKRMSVSFGGKVTRVPLETNHAALTHRDDPDQHPIKAITRLQEELAARTDRAMTNTEIDDILNL